MGGKAEQMVQKFSQRKKGRNWVPAVGTQGAELCHWSKMTGSTGQLPQMWSEDPCQRTCNRRKLVPGLVACAWCWELFRGEQGFKLKGTNSMTEGRSLNI